LGAEIDLGLVRRMAAGDEQALSAFYGRWFPIVNALITRMLKSADDVEDVVEETFWQAWRQANRFAADRGSVQTWVLTIARSRALDRLRAARRLREDSLVDSSDSGAIDGSAMSARSTSDPSADAEHSERRQLVVAALSELPHEQRQALELGYFGGLSQTEIAELTGLTYRYVRDSLIERGIRPLTRVGRGSRIKIGVRAESSMSVRKKQPSSRRRSNDQEKTTRR
jgi:RNA polymerase sigma-70 factor (ECF subfamily)